jgi:hypothetical protein
MTSLRPPSTSVPPALQRLLEGDASAFAAGALYAHAAPEEDLHATRSLARDPATIAAVLAARGPETPEVLTGVADGRDCFAEGRLDDTSFVVSLQLADDGAIARALWLASAPVPPSGGQGDPGDARPILERYFTHLQAGEFEAAVACFSDDVLYSHPPYRGDTERAQFRGHDELLHGLVHKRGISPARQVITGLVQRGPECFIEGIVEGVPNSGTFVSSVSLAADGRMARYAAWYCTPRVERV